MGSNALLFSLGQSKAGFLVKSMRLIPTNMVGQTCERVILPWLPREACYDQERGQSEVEKDTVTLNEKQDEVLPRRKDKTPNDTWVAFGVRSVVAKMTFYMVKLTRETDEPASMLLVTAWCPLEDVSHYDVDCRRRSTSSRTRCRLVKLAKMLHELDISSEVSSNPARVER